MKAMWMWRAARNDSGGIRDSNTFISEAGGGWVASTASLLKQGSFGGEQKAPPLQEGRGQKVVSTSATREWF